MPVSGDDRRDFTVSGFYYIEKNHHETMCAQAAIYGVVKYWQNKKTSLFTKVSNTNDINQMAGVMPDDPELANNRPRGLTIHEIMNFFKANKMSVWAKEYRNLTFNSLKKEQVLQDIYSFVESGVPVMAVIKTDGGLHVITIIGHTFDKNGWNPMAAIGYYGEVEHVKSRYLSNIVWVENLLVIDDNFGPYYFFPSREIEKLIAYLVVPIPVEHLLRPREAIKYAKETFFSETFSDATLKIIRNGSILKENKFWLAEFIKHLQVNCGDGLVMRSILMQSGEIINAYSEHEFRQSISDIISTFQVGSYFWLVELSWPELYCFRQARCGAIIFSAHDNNSGASVIVHLPGILLCLFEGQLFEQVAKKEDAPHSHFAPGK